MFLASRQFLDLVPDPDRVVPDFGASPDMNGHIVPGRHNFPGFALGCIPGGRHIMLGPLKDHETLFNSPKFLPLCIGASEMAVEQAELGAIVDHLKRRQIRHQACCSCGDEKAKRVVPNEPLLDINAVLTKVRWLVHLRTLLECLMRTETLALERILITITRLP